MSEIIVKLTDSRIKLKGGEYVRDLVRCKDCKHYKRNIPCVGGHYNGCDEWIDEGSAIAVYDNDYCSYGERSEE